MSYVKLDIENLQETRENVRRVLLEKERRIEEIAGSVNVHEAEPSKSRRLFAVDSGFNTA